MADSNIKRRRGRRSRNGKPASAARRKGPANSSVNGNHKLDRVHKPQMRFAWADAISDEQWTTYHEAILAVRNAGVRSLLGGGFALATYTGRWRCTKDIDFYIFRRDRNKAIAALTKAGFTDYYKQAPYDRKWIYRSIRNGVIVDIIWAMANQRAQVDEEWFQGAPSVRVRHEVLRMVPMEEFIWCKLYIVQRDHCDWIDVFNVLYAAAPRIDWAHVLKRLGEDTPLLAALLTVYGWLCPERAKQIPPGLRRRLGVPRPKPQTSSRDRVRLLDSRDWFAANLPRNKPLAI